MPKETRPTLTTVRKRDGRLEPFNPAKIARAIGKAMVEVGKGGAGAADSVAKRVTSLLEEAYDGRIPSVEDIQDTAEEALMERGYPEVAKAYILYRSEHAKVRQVKEFFGVKDDLKLGVNAIKVLERRYLKKDETGRVIETPSQLFRRVARAIAQSEQRYGAARDVIAEYEELFYGAMTKGEFLPNSPTLMNAGQPKGQLSACFVLPIEDNLESIFDSLKATALIHQSGGGTGFSFGRIRPRGDIVRSTGGVASGPISFIRIFDTVTDVIKQGGRRRGANMGILPINHPDIADFATCKSAPGFLENFNISVTATDAAMRAIVRGGDIPLKNPRSNKIVGQIKAKEIFDIIATNTWKTGDPGMIWIDEINRKNPTRHVGEIESTNPCGELPLHPRESCNLGSINVGKFIDLPAGRQGKGKTDWKRLSGVVRLGVRFLDDVIEANVFPSLEIGAATLSNRRIGLGVMGFAEALIKMGLPYDSPAALLYAARLMKFVRDQGWQASRELGKSRGSFPNFKGSLWQKKGFRAMRNATVTTIAPTGTISIIAGASSGIEPLFAIAFIRNVMEGTRLLEVNPLFEEIARKRKFYSTQMMFQIAQSGTLAGIKGIPPGVRRLFRTALEIKPEWHIRMQAVFQRFTDNAVSKTINLPRDATPEDVRKAYLLAWRLKCKGITVYRYGSKPEQVLTIGPIEKGPIERQVSVESEFSGGCPAPVCNF